VNRRLDRAVNHKKIDRILDEEDLLLDPGDPPRVRVRKTPGSQIEDKPDTVYQMDTLYVWVDTVGWLYLDTVVDCCTSEWLAHVFDERCRAQEAIRLVNNLIDRRLPEQGTAPGTVLQPDNDGAFIADEFKEHAEELGFQVESIRVGTPEDNGVIESLYAGLRRDYLNLVEFTSRKQAVEYVGWMFVDYNEGLDSKRGLTPPIDTAHWKLDQGM
jgi:transposase InsO family protein